MTDEETNHMGGEDLLKMLETMEEDGKMYFVTFNLKENFMTLTSVEEETGVKKMPLLVENVDFMKDDLLEINHGGFTMCWVARNDEDEFKFGTKVIKKEEVETSKVSVLITRVLSDCNYQTFLESKTEDKIGRLAERIFI